MSDSCLVGCISDYECNPLRKVPDFASMAPFVKASFQNGSDWITVGNKSYPQRNNEAIIKSFEFNKSDGKGATVEIFDEQGGAFTNFWDELPKSLDTVDEKHIMIIEFGWVVANCDGSSQLISSPKIMMVLMQIETNFTEGKIKFKVEGTDIMQHAFHARSSKSFGGDKTQQMPLKDAIIELFNTGHPKCKVKFLRKAKGGGDPQEWDFQKDLPPRGPEDRWSSDNQNKLAVAMSWLTYFHTDNEKGIIATSDTEKNEIIFWEDPNDPDQKSGCGDSLGTFIVNGGSCSCVLDFSPTINWPLSFAQCGSGGGSSPSDHKTVRKKNDDVDACKDEDAGPMEVITVSSQAVNAFGTAKALEKVKTSQEMHTKANAIWLEQPIQAELRIVGNPDERFCFVTRYGIGRVVSIVVINPFHLIGGGDGDCPEWLAQPGCNEHLSNKQWLVVGCSHSITEGSFTTTLKVELPKSE